MNSKALFIDLVEFFLWNKKFEFFIWKKWKNIAEVANPSTKDDRNGKNTASVLSRS
jgi:hypothetical protein